MNLLDLAGVSKRFGGVQALREVDLSVARGEVRGLVGENGSGKTTLVRVLAGTVRPDAGTVHVGEAELAALDPTARLRAGVGVVFQEASVCPDLSVGENLFLGRLSSSGFVSWGDVHRRSTEILRDAGLPLHSTSRVRSISQDGQHLTEVARALAHEAQVLVFDETTASLSSDHVDRLFTIIRRAKAAGAATIFISHRLHEVFEICDTITVLRDGELRGTVTVAESSEAEVIRLMVGRSLERQFFREPAPKGDIVLRLSGVRAGRLRAGVDLEVHAGEVVGIGGLVGSGRSTLLKAAYGLVPRTGVVTVRDGTVPGHNPRAAIRAGMGYVPEDRRAQGLAMEQAVRSNATMVLTGSRSLRSLASRDAEDAVISQLFERLALRANDLGAPVRTLSGGNQQKVVLGRWLAHRPPVLLLDEPTRGIDVGAKREIYDLVHALALDGTAVLMVSSELPELLGLCDRIVVLREGHVVGEFPRGVDEERLAAAMAGAAATA